MPGAGRSLAVALGILWWAVCATPALALDGGTGLYAPFPSPASGPQAQRYVAGFGRNVTPDELRQGRSVSPRLPAPPGAGEVGAASRRAGRGSSERLSDLGWGLGAGLLLIAGMLAMQRSLWRPARINVRRQG